MIDERVALHRYKSTSFAGSACGVMLGGWFLFQYYAKDTVRTDILVILAVTAAVKLGFMAYYRFRD